MADNACKEIKLALSDFDDGWITFEQAMKIVAHAKSEYLKNVEENKIEDFISHFDVVNIWKNKVAYMRVNTALTQRTSRTETRH